MTYPLCFATGWDHEDPDKAGYSLREVDMYAWIPFTFQEKGDLNHHLSIRKNHETGKFELYKWGGSRSREFEEEIVFTATESQVHQLVNKAAELWNFYHGSKDYQQEPHTVCEHRYPNKDSFCEFQETK